MENCNCVADDAQVSIQTIAANDTSTDALIYSDLPDVTNANLQANDIESTSRSTLGTIIRAAQQSSAIGNNGIAPVAPHYLSIYDVTPPPPSLSSPTTPFSTLMEPSGAEDTFPSPTDCPPHRRKLIHATRGNLWYLIKFYKGSRILYITLTFQDDNDPGFDSLTAQRRLQSAIPLFNRLFITWLFVLELNPHPHYHGLAACRVDICRGWNQPAYARMLEIQEAARTQRRPLTPDELDQCHTLAKSITTNRHLQFIFRSFRDELPPFGFRHGHPAHASPIQDPKRCINYIIKDLDKPTANFPLYRRGVKLVLKSASTVWPYSKDFGWNTPSSRKLRLQKTKITISLRLDSEEACAALMGGRNGHGRLMKLIGALNSEDHHWHEKHHDAVEVLIIRVLGSMDYDWANDLSKELIQRRYRHARGLPDAEEVPPAETVLDDLRLAVERQAREAAARQEALHNAAIPAVRASRAILDINIFPLENLDAMGKSGATAPRRAKPDEVEGEV